MLRFLLISILCFLSTGLHAAVINELLIRCSQEDCGPIENRFKDFIGQPVELNTLRERVRFKLFDTSIKSLRYEIVEKEENIILSIQAELKPIINNVEYDLPQNFRSKELENFIRIKSGDYHDQILIQRTIENLKRFYNDRGFADPEIEIVEEIQDGLVDLKIIVRLRDVMKVREIYIATTNPELIGRVRNKYAELRGQVLDKLKFRVITDQLARELFESGFYESEVLVLPEEYHEQTNEVTLRVSVKYGSLYSFSFLGERVLSRVDLINVINERIKRGGVRASDPIPKEELAFLASKDCSSSDIAQYVKDAYLDVGAYGTELKCRVVRGRNKVGLEYVNFFFELTEGKKIRVNKVSFKNNVVFTRRDLVKLYESNATEIASAGFLDESFVKSFPQTIKREYLKRGFVQVEVLEPELTFISGENAVDVTFSIIERSQVKIAAINLLNDLEDLRESVLSKITNKIGEPINIPNIDDDLSTISREVQEAGYYFAQMSTPEEELVEYNSAVTEAIINVSFNSLKPTILNSVIITGYNKTQLTVLTREIHLQDGDKISPSDILKIRDALTSLDLFSSVRVTPFVISSEEDDDFLVNLLVQVDEKDFGVAEIAPGYRTDLGLRLGVGITYNNLWGMNRIATIKAEGNRRFSYSDFDLRRREEQKQLIEYSIRASYTEPYLIPNILKTKLQFDMAIATQRKRFVSFDADIFRVSPQLTKSFLNNMLTVSLKYQFETIKQFDATNLILNDDFTIGSLTPAATIDLRNDPIRPTSGSLFNISWEFANPYFLSMENEDLTVNYYRFISRNQFYIPVSDFFTFAFSASGGIQKNFARGERFDSAGNQIFFSNGVAAQKGYIPSTKVFRLDGIDLVRGFSAEEINKLANGTNIGEVVVDDVGYFLSFKFEPRYYISDTFGVGLFLDAGRLYVNSVSLEDLRYSTGATFKVLTPVGSLDFDYGIKLNRNTPGTAEREKFGRFHLSIGFF
jgi:outer membrane protein insertion porin family